MCRIHPNLPTSRKCVSRGACGLHATTIQLDFFYVRHGNLISRRYDHSLLSHVTLINHCILVFGCALNRLALIRQSGRQSSILCIFGLFTCSSRDDQCFWDNLGLLVMFLNGASRTGCIIIGMDPMVGWLVYNPASVNGYL